MTHQLYSENGTIISRVIHDHNLSEGEYSYKRILLPKELIGLLNYKDVIAIDSHMHSSASYDNAHVPETAPAAIIQRQKDIGLIPLLTDHDTLEGIESIISSGEDIMRSVEIKFKPLKAIYFDKHKSYHTVHLNLFDIKTQQYDDIKDIISTGDMDMLADYLLNEDIPWSYNHPAWHEAGDHFNRNQMIAMARHYAPVIELNAGRPKHANDVAEKLAKIFCKGLCAGSDGHTGTGSVGRSYVIANGNNFREAWEHVVAGDATIIRHDVTSKEITFEAVKMIQQIFSDERIRSEDNNSSIVKDTINNIFDLKLPIKSHIALKSFFLWYASIFGDYTAKKLYIEPTNKRARKSLQVIERDYCLQ